MKPERSLPVICPNCSASPMKWIKDPVEPELHCHQCAFSIVDESRFDDITNRSTPLDLLTKRYLSTDIRYEAVRLIWEVMDDSRQFALSSLAPDCDCDYCLRYVRGESKLEFIVSAIGEVGVVFVQHGEVIRSWDWVYLGDDIQRSLYDALESISPLLRAEDMS